jgi:hypothetical protein
MSCFEPKGDDMGTDDPVTDERLSRRGFMKLVGTATVAASVGGMGLLRVDQAHAAPVAQRPISDFLSAQGTTSLFNPPVRDYLGWTRPFTNPELNQVLASVDYAGIAAAFVGSSLGTTISGSVHERPLADGRAEVSVILRTKNALTYVVGPPFDIRNPSLTGTGPLSFAYRPQDIVANPSLRPGLAESHLNLVFKNTAPGAPLPDAVEAFFRGIVAPGQELVSVSFRANAAGPLRALAGLGPDGTPGRCIVTQSGVLFRGGPHFSGARSDGFPVERVELRRTG